MLKTKGTRVYDIVQNAGTVDYIDEDGKLQIDEKQPTVMVRSATDLSSLVTYPTGSIAYTAGFKTMWQKNHVGEWVEV